MMFLPNATTLDASACSRPRRAQNTLEPRKRPIQPQRRQQQLQIVAFVGIAGGVPNASAQGFSLALTVPGAGRHDTIFAGERAKIVAKL